MDETGLRRRRRSINRDDPRVRRTLKLLGETLLTLIDEKGYEAVSIQEITDRANVSRTTFYLHFKDKDELLFASMRAIYDELSQAIQPIDLSDLAAAEAAMCDPADFEHVRKYFNFYRVMLSEKGSLTFLLRVMDYLATLYVSMVERSLPPGVQPRVPLAFLAASAAGAELGVVRWWIQNEMPYTPAQMARFLYEAQVKGLWWALGLTTA